MKTEFTGATKAWISSPEWKNTAELQQLLEKGDADRAAEYLSFSGHDMSTSGWIEVGAATVTVTLHNNDAVTAKQIKALHAELQSARAEAQQRENYILERISKLQALTYEPATVAEPESF